MVPSRKSRRPQDDHHSSAEECAIGDPSSPAAPQDDSTIQAAAGERSFAAPSEAGAGPLLPSRHFDGEFDEYGRKPPFLRSSEREPLASQGIHDL